MGIRLDITNDMAKADEIKILDKLTKSFAETRTIIWPHYLLWNS